VLLYEKEGKQVEKKIYLNYLDNINKMANILSKSIFILFYKYFVLIDLSVQIKLLVKGRVQSKTLMNYFKIKIRSFINPHKSNP
jgi:hypothetical protein